jgi:acyl-CoA thioester hydrolase
MEAIFTHRIEVRFRDCDPLDHVNNAVYLTYLEQARIAHWRSLWGFRTAEAVPEMPGVILARAEIDYRRPARFGDLLDVRIGVSAIGRTSFTYEYEIVDRDSNVVATARTVLVMYDYAASKPVAVPDSLREMLRQPPAAR